MNFHISPFSPLRPKFSSGNLAAARSQHVSPRLPQHDTTADHDHAPFDDSGPIRVAVESPDADDEMTHDLGIDDTDSPSDASADADDDVTQDSRDVLVQRLNDLADKLNGADLRPSSVEALHRQVDDMERILRSGGRRDRSTSRHSSRWSVRRESGAAAGPRPRSLQLPPATGYGGGGGGGVVGGESPRGRENALGIMPSISPSWFMSRFSRQPAAIQEDDTVDSKEADGHGASSLGLHHHHSGAHQSGMGQQQPLVGRPVSTDVGTITTPPEISSEVAETVVKEAEKLCAEMATVIESLQTRREESDHIYAILIQREKMAHKRLVETTTAVSELQEVVADNEAELRHLRLELRAIEVQCMDYVPKGADPELDQSIRNWKDDWESLREQFAARRGRSLASGDESSTFSAMTSPSSR